MTENRAKYIGIAVQDIQKEIYYHGDLITNELIADLKKAIKTDRLIKLLIIQLARHNPNIGRNPEIKEQKINEIIQKL